MRFVRMLMTLTCLAFLPAAFGGTVYLNDGSILKGRVMALDAKTLVLNTQYAGSLHIKRSALRGMTTAQSIRITPAGGDAMRGRLVYNPKTNEQRAIVNDDDKRQLSLETTHLAVVNRTDSTTGAVASAATTEQPDTAQPDLWSGTATLGLNGKAGNTESRSLNLKITTLRDAGDNRLSLAATLDREMTDDQLTAGEVRGKARYEHDFAPRLFSYAMQRLSRDEFNHIKLRSRTTAGVGYVLVRDERTSLKLRSGVGYKYEKFTSGATDNSVIVPLGWQYSQLVGDWLELTHDFTFFFEASDHRADNFAIASELGVQVPIANSDAWSVAAELSHEYNNTPPAGVEKLDTSYMIGIVREFD